MSPSPSGATRHFLSARLILYMTESIRSSLEREVHKLIVRYNSKCQTSAINRSRYAKRSGRVPSAPSSQAPNHWKAHPHFSPFYVRPRIDTIIHSITSKICDGTYIPSPVLLMDIPKQEGGTREISILTIPDAAVSYTLGKRLIERNSHFFSSYTYAYRSDRNAHHAIQHLMTELRGCSRIFLLEYDFAKYFDSINHDYLLKILQTYFQVTRHETELIRKFIKNQRASGINDYINSVFDTPDCGIPQGSTLSLFLANAACHELDREIEHAGVVFARYADDTLILCNSYEKADRCARYILDHGKRSGTTINFKKSDGISLLSSDLQGEMKTKISADFLAHTLSSKGVTVSLRSILRIKKKISQIIYRHLLLQPTRREFNSSRIGDGFRDWDLVTCINEIRRYIYGRISESTLNASLDGTTPFNMTRGALSYYPTVDSENSSVFKSLDGWLCNTLCRAYNRRISLLQNLGIELAPIDKMEMISGSWYQFPELYMETRLPSFFKSWLYVKRCSYIFGLMRFPSPLYDYI